MALAAIQASGQFALNNSNGNKEKEILANRIMNAKGSKWFIRKKIVKGGRLALYKKAGLRRKSRLPHARAIAMNPSYERIARQKYLDGKYFFLIFSFFCFIFYGFFFFLYDFICFLF